MSLSNTNRFSAFFITIFTRRNREWFFYRNGETDGKGENQPFSCTIVVQGYSLATLNVRNFLESNANKPDPW